MRLKSVLIVSALLSLNFPSSESIAKEKNRPAEEQASANSEEEEEVVDFEEEEARSAAESNQMKAAAGIGGPGGRPKKGFKIFVDMLLDHDVGEKKFEFRPNHTYVLLQATVTEEVVFTMHVSDDPLFFELQWNLTPTLSLKAGKMLIPFGSNEFHHLIGGRVDELSHFLPETWADYGLGLHHLAYDGDHFALEYDLYAVNGFQGTGAPLIGIGTVSDNNANKGIGLRVKASFLGGLHLIGSLYYDVWDAEDVYNLVYYALALELSQGFIDLPVLDRIGLRGEWARGEFRLPTGNYQRGILEHAYARAGFYGELKARLYETLQFRFRTGRINPDNTVTDAGDLWVFEPALMYTDGPLTYTVAYQMTMYSSVAYGPTSPPDVLYAKFFLQY